ncbi:MAG: molybdate ABC transporter ATP-binding protein ModF [Gammaproteobacteria bacterium]|nr:molybdate ABC transporter ATP-binding protein ModF [Gammaproteobacteria bacterium]
MRISNLTVRSNNQLQLQIEKLELPPGQSLLICGDNASGKSLLARVISGEITPSSGKIITPKNIATVSFTLEEQVLAQDRHDDDSETIAGGIDWGRSAKSMIGDGEQFDTIVELLQIATLLDKPFKVLSTGETRKVLLAQALIKQPQLLILDQPYAGLDITSQHHLTSVLEQVIANGTSVILVDFYHSGLPSNIDQITLLKDGKVAISGTRHQVLASQQWRSANTNHVTLPHHLPDCYDYQNLADDQPFISINDVSIAYQDNRVFSHLNWSFEPGQHWRLSGPNGCGKSTLLGLINGDNTKAYGKDITLFGVKRGSGETVWDIKRHFGLVSAQLHRDYRASCSVLAVVLSGFFDSIGLYESPSEQQIIIAKQWLKLLAIEGVDDQPFSGLSYGEQRLVLIARAIVKLPLILILDEPCLGLDNHNRAQVLALIDYITRHSNTHILFVSHDARDQLACLSHQLTFEPIDDHYQVIQSRIK